ncbi:hypothetical protein KMU_05920 [Proteus vulgaris]|uniref:hypothetical protein n=1 Tax=Proteus vulgaris TaxID=585 RepID=UPI002557C0FF|nr:hypothetical protein [Proteus vulgaris]GLX62552.1 hypothetical protein KMU_05920 [Proteus vulgaris]
MDFGKNNNSIFMKMDGFNVNSESDLKDIILDSVGELEEFKKLDDSGVYAFTIKDSYMYHMVIDNVNNYMNIELAIGGVMSLIKEENLDYLKNLVSFVNYYKSRCTIGSIISKDNHNIEDPSDFDFIVTYRVISPDIKNRLGLKKHIERAIEEIDNYLNLTLDKVHEL